MVEELRSFPARSHQVNQPQRREEMLLTSFPPGAQGSQVKQGRRVASSARALERILLPCDSPGNGWENST